jgi:hypothetical protein
MVQTAQEKVGRYAQRCPTILDTLIFQDNSFYGLPMRALEI